MTVPRFHGRAVAGNLLVGSLLLVLALWSVHLQPAAWPEPTPLAAPRLWAGVATILFIGVCVAAWRARDRGNAQGHAGTAGGWRVVHASQTGFAADVATRTAEALRAAGHAASVHGIGEIEIASLHDARCLFVASTTGEGDPPDAALRFAGQAMAAPAALAGMSYAVLALGDRKYARFCAFARQLDDWLQASGGHRLFDVVEVDNADPGALRHWQHHVGLLAGSTDQSDWARPRYTAWTLVRRRLLNAGSAGGPVYQIDLAPPGDLRVEWHAGDIAEIGARQPPECVAGFLDACGLDPGAQVDLDGERMTLRDALAGSYLPEGSGAASGSARDLAKRLRPLPHREYSIASLPSDGMLQLLVRLVRREDGRPGLGSGWLCLGATIGGQIDLRIRGNPNFHPPDPGRPLILVGNGTGLAGLLAHLKARIAVGEHRNWLVYGERNAAHDALHDDILSAWQAGGQLAFLDRVYSRDGKPMRYVQDALRGNADRLLAWADAGAAIYVCGSLNGMAPAVDEVLTEVLGTERLANLAIEGRYRRDVY